MLDPAGPDEKICWSENLLSSDVQCEDLEDPDGHYKVLGCSKTSGDEAIAAAFKYHMKLYQQLARMHHPDKAPGDTKKHEIFAKAKDCYEAQKAVIEVLGRKTERCTSYPKRVEYDERGEYLCMQFNENL